MKNPPFILVGNHPESVRLVILLQRLSLSVEVFSDIASALAASEKAPPALMLIESGLLAAAPSSILNRLTRLAKAGCCTVQLGSAPLLQKFPCDSLAFPVKLAELQALLRRRVANYSRQAPRIDTSLPGLYANGEVSHFCEIVNLSASGAFIKLGTPLAEHLESVQLFIPLLGMKKELEIPGDIVFQTRPSEENNYRQGAGIRFRIEDETVVRQLEAYLDQTIEDELQAVVVYPLPHSFTPATDPDSPPPYAASDPLGS